MKAIVLCLLIVCAVTADAKLNSPQMTFDDLLLFLKGLFSAWEVRKEEVHKLVECVRDLGEIEHEIDVIMEELKKIDIKNIRKLAEIIARLFEAIQKIFKDIKPCIDATEDIKKLVEKIMKYTVYEMIIKIITHIMHDSKEIYDDIILAIDYYNKGDYEKFGYYVGEILEILFLKD